MFLLQAPMPLVQTTTVLPNPQLSDGENNTAEVAVQLTMAGTRRTYVKRKDGRRRLLWSFKLTRNKALELRAFIQAYHSSTIRVVDHNERAWVGNFTSNPFEFDTEQRAAPAIAPLPAGEQQAIQIEFEGVEDATVHIL